MNFDSPSYKIIKTPKKFFNTHLAKLILKTLMIVTLNIWMEVIKGSNF